jgi:tRNA A-37 threonylcarbamoyl transferase component Bud32
MRRRIIHARSPAWRDAIERAEALIGSPEFRLIKDEAKTLAGFATLADGQIAFLKRFAAGSWAEGIIERTGRGSRAARSLAGARLLGEHGFAHPAPYAGLEEIAGGAIRRGYLMSEALVDALSLSHFIDRGVTPNRRDPRWRAALMRAVAREIRRLHDTGIRCSDLQETNLMVEELADGFKVHFVDLDGMRRVADVSWHDRARNLIQLDRSVGRFLSRGERLSFLHAYLGFRPGRDRARTLIAELLAERARKEGEYMRRRDGRMAH